MDGGGCAGMSAEYGGGEVEGAYGGLYVGAEYGGGGRMGGHNGAEGSTDASAGGAETSGK